MPIQLGAAQPADIERLFPSWPQSLIRELGPETRAIAYLGGETILKAGQRGAPGLVLAGLLRLYIESNEGRQATVRYVKPGQVLAPITPFHALPGTLAAVVNSTVIQFKEGAANRVARRNADFAWELARALAEWALYLTSTVAYVAFGTVRERIAAHLIELASPSPSSCGRLEVHLTQQELADVVGSVREVVNRALKDFRAQGLIGISSESSTKQCRNLPPPGAVCKACTSQRNRGNRHLKSFLKVRHGRKDSTSWWYKTTLSSAPRSLGSLNAKWTCAYAVSRARASMPQPSPCETRRL